jgi:hypothetical protein
MTIFQISLTLARLALGPSLPLLFGFDDHHRRYPRRAAHAANDDGHGELILETMAMMVVRERMNVYYTL